MLPTPSAVIESPEPAPATATAEASGDAGKKSADDILAMIRNRQSS